MLKSKKGITLIALIITIIVLLILAGISISMTTKDDSVISRAEYAKEEERYASIIEEKNLWKLDVGDEVSITELENIVKILKEKGLITDAESKTILSKGYFIINDKTIEFRNIVDLEDNSDSSDNLDNSEKPELNLEEPEKIVYMNGRLDGLNTEELHSEDASVFFEQVGIYAEQYEDVIEIKFEKYIPSDFTEIEKYVDLTSDIYGNFTNEGIAYAWITGEEGAKILHYGQRGGVVLSEKGITLPACTNAIKISGLNTVDTSNVKDMSLMFLFCSSITELDLSNFDTSNATNMIGMFIGNNKLESLDLSSFDTSNVTNMSAMFALCSAKTIDLSSSFNTSKVTDMSAMFSAASQLTNIDLSNFDTSNVIDMSGMFSAASQLTNIDLSNFDTSNVTDMSGMFENSGLTSIDLSNFNTSNVTDMSSMFYSSDLTSLDLTNFNTSKVTDMNAMFTASKLTSIDLSNFDTSNVTDMSSMFQASESLTELDLSNFNTSKVTDMMSMFSHCTSLKVLKLNNFDISNVVSYDQMFGYVWNGLLIGNYPVPANAEITTNATMKEWIDLNFRKYVVGKDSEPHFTNIIVVE